MIHYYVSLVRTIMFIKLWSILIVLWSHLAFSSEVVEIQANQPEVAITSYLETFRNQSKDMEIEEAINAFKTENVHKVSLTKNNLLRGTIKAPFDGWYQLTVINQSEEVQFRLLSVSQSRIRINQFYHIIDTNKIKRIEPQRTRSDTMTW